MYRKKFIFLLIVILFLSGCTKITDNLDDVVSATMTNDKVSVNTVSTGYELYVPTGVEQVSDNEYNQKFKIKDRYVYLYVDTVSYYYKNMLNYKSNNDYNYYYKELNIDGKTGYIGVIKQDDGLYFCEVVYNYTGQFAATPEAQSMAASWYNAGTQVVFGCGGAVGNSVMSAAEGKNQQDGAFVAKVIGVDVDQYSESDTVITSAMKMLANSVYDAVSWFYDGSFKGGQVTTFNVQNNGVGIAMDHAKFDKFTRDEYDEVYKKLQGGEWSLMNNTDNANPAKALTLSNTKVTFIE